jgi:hypothetical protein
VAVLVDSPLHYPNVSEVPKRHRKKRWCHMFSDSLDELHKFARKLRLKKEWFQDHPKLKHYDITERTRDKAVSMGALEVSCKLTAKLLRTQLTPGKLIKQEPYLIRYFASPSEDLCKLAVKISGGSLYHISNQTTEICEIAVKSWSGSIQFVKNQTPELCLLAVGLDGNSLRFIRNQSDDIITKAVENTPESIRFAKNPCVNSILYAIRKSPGLIKWISEPPEEVWVEVLGLDGSQIQNLMNPSEDLKEIAIKQNPRSLTFIDKVTKNLLKLVITEDEDIKDYIKYRFGEEI